jgi:hypothetical protein
MKHVVSAIVLAAFAVGAQAQVTFSGGTDRTSLNGYNPNGSAGMFSPAPVGGREDAIVSSSGGNLTATFLGFEAVDDDTFTFDLGGLTLSNKGPLDASIAGIVGAGLLNFRFADTTDGTFVGNGQGLGEYTSYAVLGSFAGSVFTPYTMGGAYDLILGFNDGARVDADYDDMVVGLKVTPVPEPETYALMLAGLGALGAMSRRRKARQS